VGNEKHMQYGACIIWGPERELSGIPPESLGEMGKFVELDECLGHPLEV